VTPRGYAVAAVGVVSGVAGWLLGYPELTVVSAGCLAALVVAAGWLLAGLSLRITRQVAPAKVPRGDPAIASVRAVNTGRRTSRAVTALDRCGATTVDVALPGLARGASRFVSYRLPTTRRGELPVGPMRLRAGDPLGLFRREREYGCAVSLLVRPRTAPLPILPSGRAASLEGPTCDTAPSGTVTFHALREYVTGDDLRHVHWRTTARTGTLMVRQLVDSSLPVTTVVVDCRPASYIAPGEDFDIAVDAAATVAAGMAAAGFPVTLLTTDGRRFGTRSARGTGALLDWLAGLQASARGDLETVLAAPRRLPAAGTLTVVTGTACILSAERLVVSRRVFTHVTVIRAGREQRGGATLPVTVIDAASAEDVASSWRWTR
jgi:uncharacterized protein (DUF58 family)